MSHQPKPPNIVLICSDQHSFNCTGYAGHPVVRTPNLDRLAERGVVFDAAYCQNPVCVPGRAALMTGMYASDCNSFCNSTTWDGSHPTFGNRLTEAGYRCLATGKFDLDDRFDMGFEMKDVSNGHCRNPDITSLFRAPVCLRSDTRRMIDGEGRDERKEVKLRENTLEFLRQCEGEQQPWLIWSGFSRPHPAYIGPRKLFEEYLAADIPMPAVDQAELEAMHPVYREMRHFQDLATPVDPERIRRARAAYYAMVTELDEDIGIIYDALEESGELENTWFIYTSDHGESLGEHGQWMKSNLMEESVHVPMIISGPALPKGKRISTPVSHLDLIATLVALGGGDITGLRGCDLRPLMTGEGEGPPFVFSESHNSGSPTGFTMIRRGPWKCVEFVGYPEGQLFNLEEDPGETRNCFDDPACGEIRRELQDLLRSTVNPEEVNERAFQAQEKKLRELTDGKSEEEIVGLLERRLGLGQSRSLAKAIVRRRSFPS